MSAFNTVSVPWTDPKNGEEHVLRVQFKYGDTWQHEYAIGDRLKWGGNDIGPKNVKHVIAEGYLEGDPPADMGEEFEVHIKGGVITEVVPDTGFYRLATAKETYVVVDDSNSDEN